MRDNYSSNIVVIDDNVPCVNCLNAVLNPPSPFDLHACTCPTIHANNLSKSAHTKSVYYKDFEYQDSNLLLNTTYYFMLQTTKS